MMSDLRDSTPPFYFRRIWDPQADTREEVVYMETKGNRVEITLGVPGDPGIPANVEVIPMQSEPLLIYGRKIVSPYAEDAAYIRRIERQGLIYTESFSVACVDGETGSHPLDELTEITKDEFDQARARGWTRE